MTITQSLKPVSKPVLGQRGRIAAKLNSLVGSSDFFKWREDKLISRSCASVKQHNRVIIFLALFVDGNYNEMDNFTMFGEDHGMAFSLNERLLNKLENTLDNIQSVDDINITIN